MALIQPNGKVQLFNSLRLDSGYEHTYYFSSVGAQTSFFDGKVSKSFSNLSYTRKSKSIKLQVTSDDIYTCNYLRFQNTAFGSKWFYAFITKIEYISNNVSEIFFELDVIQTWLFQFSLNGNFVERIHTQSDDLFEHIEPDIAPFGDDYIFTKVQRENYSNLNVCVQSSYNAPGDMRSGGTINNIFSQLYRKDGISVQDDVYLNEYINTGFAGHTDDIKNIYEYPEFVDNATSQTPARENKSFQIDTNVLDNHTIVNKKCLCYPYNFLILSNNQGSNNILRFEDFENSSTGTIRFSVCGVKYPTPELMMYPLSHKRISNDYENGVTVNNFPTCCFSGNAYSDYVAQNQNSNAISTIMAGAGIATSAMTGNVAGLSVGLAQGASYYASQLDKMYLPTSSKGQLNSVGLHASLNRYGFTLYQKCLSTELIRQVDNYFTKYGYAINRIVQSINRSARPKFTYVKLRNASIYGNVPAEDCRKIEEIHNNGVTYWLSSATIGDYSGNSPA